MSFNLGAKTMMALVGIILFGLLCFCVGFVQGKERAEWTVEFEPEWLQDDEEGDGDDEADSDN